MLRQGYDAIVDQLRKRIREQGDGINLDPFLDKVDRLEADQQTRAILRAALLQVAQAECNIWRKKQQNRGSRFD